MMISASRIVSAALSFTTTFLSSLLDISSAKRSRDSGRLLVTRISSKSNSRSSMATLYQEVPRAPMCPSTRGFSQARYFAPTAVTAPVRIHVVDVALMMAYGAPLSGRNSVKVANSDGMSCS